MVADASSYISLVHGNNIHLQELHTHSPQFFAAHDSVIIHNVTTFSLQNILYLPNLIFCHTNVHV